HQSLTQLAVGPWAKSSIQCYTRQFWALRSQNRHEDRTGSTKSVFQTGPTSVTELTCFLGLPILTPANDSVDRTPIANGLARARGPNGSAVLHGSGGGVPALHGALRRAHARTANPRLGIGPLSRARLYLSAHRAAHGD